MIKRAKGARVRVQGRIEGDRCIVPLTVGNLKPKNSHFLLRTVLDFFPKDCIGGCDRSQLAPRFLTVTYDGGTAFKTDIAGKDWLNREGKSAHWFFREGRQTELRSFFERTSAAPGDEVVVIRDSLYFYMVTLRKSA